METLDENAYQQKKGKVIISVCLAVILAFTQLPTSASALEDEDDPVANLEDIPSWLAEAPVSDPIDLDAAIEASNIDIESFEDYGSNPEGELILENDFALGEALDAQAFTDDGGWDGVEAEAFAESDVEGLDEVEAESLAESDAEGLGGVEAESLAESDAEISEYVESLSDDIEIQAAPSWKRLQGAGRYDTMSAIVKQAFPKGPASKMAIIATGNTFPDALSASSLAGALNVPIILTGKAGLTAQADKQIKALGIKNVIIIGSTAAISAKVENTLVKKLGKANVTRCKGSNRYETAYAIYNLGLSLEKKSGKKVWGNVAFIATGNNFPDALSAGPIAYKSNSPIFLYNTASKNFEKKQLKALKSGKFKRIILLGSAKVLPESIRKDLGKYGSKSICIRLAGSDRFLTSLAVADFGIKSKILGNGVSSKYVALATGSNFPDALSGASLCGRIGAPLYLVSDSPQGRVGFYRSMARSVYHKTLKTGYIFGSAKAVPASILTKAKSLGSPTKFEQEVINLVNKERKKAGVPPLKVLPILQGVCDIRADEITKSFDHRRPGGNASFDSAFTQDLAGRKVMPISMSGENILWYSNKNVTASRVMQFWMESPGHRSNILGSNYKYIGVGEAIGPDGGKNLVQFFAR